jgi:microcystin-dependent protein
MPKRTQDFNGDGRAIPTGTVFPFAGSSAPSGWLLCAGQSTGILRTTYKRLFAVIGTTYGAGDGSTTFNLPDLRGRSAFGKDDMGGSAASRLTSPASGIAGNTLGASGGAQSKGLSTAELPSHQHGVSTSNPAPTKVTTGGTLPVSASSNTGTVSANHGHTVWIEGGSNRATAPGGVTGGPFSTNIHYTSSQDANHTHSFSFSTTAAGSNVTISGNTDNAGSGSSFGIVNPALVLNYIIKY